jgi:hypothetical protein
MLGPLLRLMTGGVAILSQTTSRRTVGMRKSCLLHRKAVMRLAVAVLGSTLGGTVGAMAGGIAGYLLMSLAVMVDLITNTWGLAPIIGLVIGGIGGGAGGWIGGFARGAVFGTTSPRLNAIRLYGGMASGAMAVLFFSVRSLGIDWSRGGQWLDLLEMLLIATATGALGTVTASISVGRLVRAFVDRREARAGA